jgi:hypothetical protein
MSQHAHHHSHTTSDVFTTTLMVPTGGQLPGFYSHIISVYGCQPRCRVGYSIDSAQVSPALPDEQVDKRKMGECYFCPPKFTQDHVCPMKRVFIMELDEQDDPESVAEDRGISLHALTGLSSTNTMQLIVSIGGTQLCTLVDSRSAHTFIHDKVVHRLGMAIMFPPGLSVRIANGEHMQSYGTCRSTALSIQG